MGVIAIESMAWIRLVAQHKTSSAVDLEIECLLGLSQQQCGLQAMHYTSEPTTSAKCRIWKTQRARLRADFGDRLLAPEERRVAMQSAESTTSRQQDLGVRAHDFVPALEINCSCVSLFDAE